MDPKVPETALDLFDMKSLFQFRTEKVLPKVHQLISRGSSSRQSKRFYTVYFRFATAYFQTNLSEDETHKTDQLYPFQSQNGNLIGVINEIMTTISWDIDQQLRIAAVGNVRLNNSSSSLSYARLMDGKGGSRGLELS